MSGADCWLEVEVFGKRDYRVMTNKTSSASKS